MEFGDECKNKDLNSCENFLNEEKSDEQIIDDLRVENEKLKLHIKELTSKNSNSVSKEEDISQISLLTEQLAHERNENDRLQEKINGLQESLVKNKQELLTYQQRVYDSEILSTRFQHEKKVLEHEKNTLQESLKKQQEEMSILENKMKELHTTKNNILLDSTKKLSNLEISCRDFEHKISLIQKSRDDLEIEHSKTCDELRRVKSELEFAKGHYEGKIKIKEEAIRLKEEQIQQIQGLLDMSINTAQTLEKEVEKLRDNTDSKIVDSQQIQGISQDQDDETTDLFIKNRNKKLTDTQAAELLIKIFGETFFNDVSALGESKDNNVVSRRIVIDLLTQLEDYQQTLEESRQQVHNLQQELKECQYHLKFTVPDFELTRQQYEALQAENSFALEQLQSMTQERRLLMHEISDLKNVWQHETNKREIYEEQCKMITLQFNKLASEYENLEKMNFENNNKEKEDKSLIQSINNDIIEQNTQMKLQISRLIDGIELDSQIQIRKLKSEISSYKEQFEKIQIERDELISQYQNLITKLEEENSQLKDIKSERELKEKLEDKESDEKLVKNSMNPGNFVKQLNEVTEMCKSLSEKLTNEIELSTQYRSELSRYKAQCEYMETLGERNRKRMDELFEERDNLYKQVNELRRSEDLKENELSDLKEKISDKESKFSDVKRENEHLKLTITSLNACITDLRNDMELVIKQRSQDNALQRDLISQLQGEIEGKCVEINSMRKSQDAILQREFDESQRLRQLLRNENDKYQTLETRFKDLQLEYDKLHKQLIELGNFSKINNLNKSEKILLKDAKQINLNDKMDSGDLENEKDEQDSTKLKTLLEESRKLQNYWKEIVQSTEKQLESKTKDFEKLKNKEEMLREELEKKVELIKTMEDDNQKEKTRLNESIAAMTLRISSIDEEMAKRESNIRENLSLIEEENVVLKKQIEELRQTEQDLRSQYQNIVRMHSLDIERLQNSNKQFAELKEELNSVLDKSRKTDGENTNLIIDMQNDIQQLQRQLKSYMQKYESVKNDNLNYKEILNKLRTDQQLPENYENLLVMQTEIENEDEKNDANREERRSSIQPVNVGSNSSATASLMLMRKVQTLTSSLEEMDSKLNESNIEIQRLTFERKTLREENDLLQKRLTEELERATEFASKAEANESTLIRLGELVTLRETNDRLRKELIHATERYNDLEKQFETESRSTDPLKCEINKLNAEIENLKNLCEEKSTLSKSWEEQYNRILLNYENINPNEVIQLKEEVNKLKAQNEELKNTLNVKVQEYEKLQSDKQSEHISNEELQLTKQQMEQLRKVYMSTNQKLKEERNKNNKLEKDLKKLTSINTQSQQTQVNSSIVSPLPGTINNNSNSNLLETSNTINHGNLSANNNKLTMNEIKNVSQATGNLVNVILKLTKISILKFETDRTNKPQNCPEIPPSNNITFESLKHDRNEDDQNSLPSLKKRSISANIDSKEISDVSNSDVQFQTNIDNATQS